MYPPGWQIDEDSSFQSSFSHSISSNKNYNDSFLNQSLHPQTGTEGYLELNLRDIWG